MSINNLFGIFFKGEESFVKNGCVTYALFYRIEQFFGQHERRMGWRRKRRIIGCGVKHFRRHGSEIECMTS